MLLMDAGLSVEDVLVLLDIILVLVSTLLVSSVNDGLLFVGAGLTTTGSDVIEFTLVVGLVRLAAEGVGTRLDAEHERYTDAHHDQEDDGKGLLRLEPVHATEGRLISEFHQVVNHNRDDSGVLVELGPPVIGGVIGIERVAPLVDHQEVHETEETVQDDQAAENFKDEDNSLSFVDCVKTLHDDSHAHVSHSDNH